MRCRRRRPRRGPRGPGKFSGTRWCRTNRPKTPRCTPPTTMRRSKRKTLSPEPRGRRKGRPPLPGRPKGPRKEGPSLRTTPPQPPTATRSGYPGPTPWRSRKYPDTIILLTCLSLWLLYHVKIYLCSPSKAHINLSSSDVSLSSSEMNSYSSPMASTPRPADDTEVLSQRMPGQEEVVLETPQGETPDAGLMGGGDPHGFG